MSHPLPGVTVIILNYNGLKDTLECLESLKHCTYPDFEILLLDNGSSPDQVESLRNIQMKHVRFFDNQNNLGFAGGNNVGIQKVLEEGKSRYIYFLNNDTVVEPDFLEHAVRRAESDPSIGIVSSLSLQYGNKNLVENAGHVLTDCGDSFPRGRNRPKEEYQKSVELLGACGASSLYRVETLQQCGEFDETFFLNYEDADLALRCILYGWKCVYEPKSMIYHKLSVSINKVRNMEFTLRSQQNQLKSYFYNVPLPVLIANVPLILLRDLTVMLNLLFLRWKIVHIFIKAKWLFMKDIREHVRIRRKRMRHKKVSSRYFLWHQESFIPYYWRFFVEIILKRNRSSLEY